MNSKCIFIFILSIISIGSFSQNLALERQVDWSLAGLKDTSTVLFDDIFLEDFGLIGNGIYANDSILQYVLDSVQNSNITLHFGQGNFLFKRNIILASHTLVKGLGVHETILTFDMDSNEHSFNISGTYSKDSSEISESIFKDDEFIVVSNSDSFEIEDWIQVFQNDSNLVYSTWAYKTVGQMVQIASKIGDTLFLKSPIRLDYDLVKEPFIVKISPKENIGISCLKIMRLDDTAPFQASNIFFDKAVNCWVNGVESENCTFSHIQARTSSNLSFRKNYLHHAFGYGGGGRGYGIMLHLTTNECLAEDNIFEHLRHSMILQAGANANVFAFNYSTDVFRDELPNDFAGDIVLHGNYTYANLFEQNIVANMSIDNSHGTNGRYNTFFRNRGELFGFYFTATNSPFQNIIGNEITNLNAPYNTFSYVIFGSNHYLYANNNKGTITPDSTEVLNKESYFYESKPNFVSENQWAKIGEKDSFDIVSIPARERFFDANILNANCDSYKEVQEDTTVISIVDLTLNALYISPNPVKDYLFWETKNTINKIDIYDNLGRIIFSKHIDFSTNKIDLSKLNTNFYYAIFTLESGEKIKNKFIKQ